MAIFKWCCLFGVTILVCRSSADSLTCHSGWHLNKNSCYNYGETKVTWTDAQEFCRTYSGFLAEIDTADENTFVTNLLNTKQAYQAWIGGTDILREGHWEWVSSGLGFTSFSAWGPGQPDEAGSAEDCLEYQKGTTYFWNDAPCANLANFVCETEALTSS